MSLKIGDKAPNFKFTDENGKLIRLSDFLGKNIVIYFYPKDNTPGCTTEACDFRDLHAEFCKKNTVIIGVSKDTVLSHEKFKSQYDLPFFLGSDAQGQVCEAYGVWGEKKMFGKTYNGIHRSTFLINPQGEIQAIWRKVSVKQHAQHVLNELK